MRQPKIFTKQVRQRRRAIYKDSRTTWEFSVQYIKAMDYKSLRALVPYTNKDNKHNTGNNEILLDLYNYWEHQRITLEEFNK